MGNFPAFRDASECGEVRIDEVVDRVEVFEPGRFQDVGKLAGIIARELRFLDLLDPGRRNDQKMRVSLEAILADAPEPVACLFPIAVAQ